MLRFGLLGASRISRGAILAPSASVADVRVSAVAARDRGRAAAFADEHGIDNVEPDYTSLLTSDDVDLVYNGLPPSEHAEWSIAALEAGKHVLCEKPFAMNAAESRKMVDAATRTGLRLIEAFHYRFHPLFARVLDILRSGRIGAVRNLKSRFNVPVASRPGELRYDASLGGGAMMDLGCYPVHWVRTVMAEEPAVLSAAATRHETGVDVAMTSELEFPNGVRAQVSAAMSEDLPEGLDAELIVEGENGRMTVINPLAPHTGHELIVETAEGRKSEQVAGESTYLHQLLHVVDVLEGKAAQITGGDDAIANMRVLDGIYRLSGMRSA